MAGSIKWFKYTTDIGDEFGILMDESNGETMGNTDVAPTDTLRYSLPKNIKPRRAYYRSLDNRVSRTIPLTDAAQTADVLPVSFNVTDGNGNAVEVFLSLIHGERLQRIFGNDTGLNDGDDS